MFMSNAGIDMVKTFLWEKILPHILLVDNFEAGGIFFFCHLVNFWWGIIKKWDILYKENLMPNNKLNSLLPSDTIWRQRSRSTLAQVMTCLPDGTKPLPEPMLTIPSVRSSGIHLRPVSQEIYQPSVTEISLKIPFKLLGANELTLLSIHHKQPQ